MLKCYREMNRLETFEERYNYLKLVGTVGELTFGGHRPLNQILYRSRRWKDVRREVILRDEGCDLGCKDHPIYGEIYVHHMNPITVEDILEERDRVFNLNNLISTSFRTHNGIHYGLEGEKVYPELVERKPYDTCPWR